MQRVLIAICVVLVLVGLLFLVCFCSNEARRAATQEHRDRAMQSEIAALRFLRDQMDNDIAEGYVTVAMRDPEPPPQAQGGRRRRAAQHSHDPPPAADADPGPPIIAFLAVTPDQIVHLAVPDLDSTPDARHKLPTVLSRADSAASASLSRGLSRRWQSLSGQLDDGGGTHSAQRGESGHWGRGALRVLGGGASGSVFDGTAESRVLQRAAPSAELPPGVAWVVASLDASLCPWWRLMFGSKGRGDTSNTLWRRMSIGAARSMSRGLRGGTATSALSYRSVSQPVTPGAAAVNSWFGEAGGHTAGMLAIRPASATVSRAAVSRAASFDSNSSGSLPSLPRPWSGEPAALRVPRHAGASVESTSGHLMWPGPVGVAAVSGEVMVAATHSSARRDVAAPARSASGAEADISTVSSSGLPLPPEAVLDDAGQFGVYTPPHELEPSSAQARGAGTMFGFGPILRAGSGGAGSRSCSRQHSMHAFHALEGGIAEEVDERSGSTNTM
eukprot:jgi/Ulvmu1/5539/UM023_0075.1